MEFRAIVLLTPYMGVNPEMIPFFKVPYKSFTTDAHGESITDALEDVFRALNIGHEEEPPDPRGTRYREEGHRSVSVGDIIVLTRHMVSGDALEGIYLCDVLGWERLDGNEEERNLDEQREDHHHRDE